MDSFDAVKAVEAKLKEWAEQTASLKAEESVARQGQTSIRNEQLALAKVLRGLADKLDPPARAMRVESNKA